MIAKALERASLKRHVACLKSEVDSRYASIIGTSTKIKPSWKLLSAPRNRTPVLLGESGTGKELLARSIHQWSPRHHAAGRHQLCRLDRRPYWKTNCSVMSAAPSPAPTVCKKASLKWPTAAPCFSTKSETCPCYSQALGCFRIGNFIVSAERDSCR